MSISQTVRDNLLAIVDAYLAATGLRATTVSRQFYGNQKFFDELRAGECSVTDRKLDDMMLRFHERWPAGLAWPRTKPILMSRPRPE